MTIPELLVLAVAAYLLGRWHGFRLGVRVGHDARKLAEHAMNYGVTNLRSRR